MLNISRIIADKTDTIMERWIEAVRQDRRIESTQNLSDTALGDSLPDLLKSIASVLDRDLQDLCSQKDFKEIARGSLEHGKLRARQGYDAEEIAQEYGLLRRTICSVLAPHYVKGSQMD
jgi:hypothetical protein